MRQLRSNTKIRLTLVGGIDDEELSAEINISPNIQYLGYVHHSELNKYYREADIFILDSLLDSWGMVVIESMSVGTPVIVSENTGAKEAVRNGGGLIIAPNNPLELKSSILRYLEEENFLAIKSKEAKEISRQYNMQNYKRELSAALSILR
jgi:glycosyltransferase involved in cell wall biosynthesis